MTLQYADPSALARAYLADETERTDLAAVLLDGRDPTITSAIAIVELASAVRSAGRSGRLPSWQVTLDRIEADLAAEGRIKLIPLRADPILDSARRLVLDHRLRTLDAIHLAVAIEDGRTLAAGEELVFVTRDADQAAAAAALGLAVR